MVYAVHVISLFAYLMVLRVQLKFFKKWTMGLKYTMSLKTFYTSLAALLLITIICLVVGAFYESQSDAEAKLRFNISLLMLRLLEYTARKVNSGVVAYMTWRWTSSKPPSKSKLMIKIEGLPRQLSEAAQARKDEGIKREQWVTMFGSLWGYST